LFLIVQLSKTYEQPIDARAHSMPELKAKQSVHFSSSRQRRSQPRFQPGLISPTHWYIVQMLRHKEFGAISFTSKTLPNFNKSLFINRDLAQLFIYNTNTCYLKVAMLIFCWSLAVLVFSGRCLHTFFLEITLDVHNRFLQFLDLLLCT